MHTHQTAVIIGERYDSLQGCQYIQTVHRKDIRVVLRDDAVVVRIAAFNETAYQREVPCRDDHVTSVKGYSHLLTALAEDALQQGGRFLGHDERCRCLALQLQDTATYQLMTVRCHDGQAVGCKVEEDAVHDRAKLVLCRCADSPCDVVAEHLVSDAELHL